MFSFFVFPIEINCPRVSFISRNSDLNDRLFAYFFAVWHKLKAVKAKERWLPDQEVRSTLKSPFLLVIFEELNLVNHTQQGKKSPETIQNSMKPRLPA